MNNPIQNLSNQDSETITDFDFSSLYPEKFYSENFIGEYILKLKVNQRNSRINNLLDENEDQNGDLYQMRKILKSNLKKDLDI